MTKEELMHRAIELSKNSVKTGGGPFGAVVALAVVLTVVAYPPKEPYKPLYVDAKTLFDVPVFVVDSTVLEDEHLFLYTFFEPTPVALVG